MAYLADLGAIYYAQWIGYRWSSGQVTEASQIHEYLGYPFLGFDKNNNPQIIFFDQLDSLQGSFKSSNIIYAIYDGSTWNYQTALVNATSLNDVAFDSNGYPHFTYVKGENLGYASWNGSAWNLQTLASNDYNTQSNLAFDLQNNPHINYYDSAGALIYSSWTGAEWDNQTIDANGVASGPIAFDSYGNPYIAFSDRSLEGMISVGYATVTEPRATIVAIASNGSTVDLATKGNITNSQISNVAINTNTSTKTTTVSLTITQQSSTIGFTNLTIPKSVISFGTKPTIYINNQLENDQNYTQEANNYYVFLTTNSSTNNVSIIFKTVPVIVSIQTLTIVAVILVFSAVFFASLLLYRRRRKTTNLSN